MPYMMPVLTKMTSKGIANPMVIVWLNLMKTPSRVNHFEEHGSGTGTLVAQINQIGEDNVRDRISSGDDRVKKADKGTEPMLDTSCEKIINGRTPKIMVQGGEEICHQTLDAQFLVNTGSKDSARWTFNLKWRRQSCRIMTWRRFGHILSTGRFFCRMSDLLLQVTRLARVPIWQNLSCITRGESWVMK